MSVSQIYRSNPLYFAGILSKFGAGLFLLVQVVLLLDFTYAWNDAWVEKDEQKWYTPYYSN